MSRLAVLIVLLGLLAPCCWGSRSNLVVVSSSEGNRNPDQVSSAHEEPARHSRDSQGQDYSNYDPSDFFMQMALATPAGAATNYLLPSTVKGLHDDLSQNYGMLANGLQSGYGSLASGASSLSSGTMDRLREMQQSVNKRYNSNQQLVSQVSEAFMNPQQYCANIAKAQQMINQGGQQMTQQGANRLEQLGSQVDSGLQQTGGLANQAAKQSSMLLNKISPFNFGK